MSALFGEQQMNAHQLKVIFFRTFPGNIYKKYRRRYLETKKIDRFLQLHHIQDDKIVPDIYDSVRKYHMTIEEYFQFGFYRLPPDERKEFVPDRERFLLCDRMNKGENRILFDNKALTYGKFRQFYKREVLGVDILGHEKFNQVLSRYAGKVKAFLQRHHEFILKPIDGSLGAGVSLWNVDDTVSDQVVEKLLKTFVKKNKGGFVLEEKICQVPKMAELHPKSVNTVRMNTVRFDDRIEVLHPFLRIGRGDSIVDNAGAGGIIATLDENGRVKAAADENGVFYDRLDDIGLDIIGWQVPCWKEMVDFVKQLAMVIPSNRYTGWDIALTDKGWCMVEGNTRAQFVWQIPDRVGFRSEINNILAELGL